MAGRTRTTKKLAQRIDLNYFKRLYPIPRWRRILSIAVVALGLVWLLWARERPYNAGPLAHSHALLGKNCESCHVKSGKIADQTCRACHDGPIHQEKQKFTPACTECHVEHQGSFRLAAVRDESCTQCHGRMDSGGKRVTSFSDDHPAFDNGNDPGAIRVNHEVHMKKDLRGPRGPVQLTCGDCHTSAGDYMRPIEYQQRCADCHPLQFDRRFPEPVPHKKPEVVIDYVTKRFTDYIARHPEEVHVADPADPRIMRPPLPPAHDAAEWIVRRVTDSKQLLWRMSCKECHPVMTVGETPPPAAIPTRWMKKAWFSHDAHQMLRCLECHPKAATSRETSDVLLPSIDTCRKCHRSGADAAEARCFECHAYHDWSKEKRPEGRTISDAIHQ